MIKQFVFHTAAELIVRIMVAFGVLFAFSASMMAAFFLGVLPQWIIFIGVVLVGEAVLRRWQEYH